MKFNKLYMALGVAALALTACSDDEEYTPAEAVVTPAAYFNISDSKTVDLEKSSTEFSFPIYRAEAGPAENPQVSVEIVSGDGVSPAYAPFTFLNSDTDPIFAEGATTGAIKYAVDMSQIVELNEYSFLLKVDGESTPYFITSADFVVCYVPWISMEDPSTGTLSTLTDDVLFRCVPWTSGARGLKVTLDVVVEKHPNKNLFRITNPYLNAVGAFNTTTGEENAKFTLDPNEPNYMYINAENANYVYMCEKNGEIGNLKYYDSGVCLIMSETWEGYGDLVIMNGMYYFLNQENIVLSDGYYPYSVFENAFGKFTGETIEFNNKDGIFGGMTNDKEALWDGNEWTLRLAGGISLGWASLGEVDFTDGFVAQYWGESNPSYKVAAMANETQPGIFRLENPYRNGNYPLADSSTDATGTGPWNIVFDCTDPNFVIVEPQATGFMVGTEQFIANAAGYYTNHAAQKLTKEQIIANGWNDTYDAATGTITINHPMLSGDNMATWSKVWEDVPGFQPAVVVIPVGGAHSEEATAKTAAPRGKISLAKACIANSKYVRR